MLTVKGLAALGRPFAENRGWILENVVAIDLFRRETELYYFKSRNECDFIIKKGTRPRHATQVCWELTRLNEKREFSDQRISVLPAWEWLLTYEANGMSSA